MKKLKLTTFFLVSCALAACTSNMERDESISIIKDANNHEITICDASKVKDTLTVPLSEWVESCKLVRFENSDTALFKFWRPIITDNYIGIRPRSGNFKLFDHEGKFLCDVGRAGNGPGEYAGILNSEAIDEDNKTIYLANFFNSSKILKYNMDGTFAGEIEIGERLNKPKLTLHEDGSLSLVHLYFKKTSSILGAHISKEGTVSTFKPLESSSVFTAEGMTFDHETWCFNNLPDMKMMFTYCDTLFNYNRQINQLEPEFAIKNINLKERAFYIINPLPHKYLTEIISTGTLITDMEKQRSYYVRLVNDSFGGLALPSPSFTNGWFFAMYEPAQLMEKIEKRLSESSCTKKDKEVLHKLLDSLDENDNNVMFIGKLKK